MDFYLYTESHHTATETAVALTALTKKIERQEERIRRVEAGLVEVKSAGAVVEKAGPSHGVLEPGTAVSAESLELLEAIARYITQSQLEVAAGITTKALYLPQRSARTWGGPTTSC